MDVVHPRCAGPNVSIDRKARSYHHRRGRDSLERRRCLQVSQGPGQHPPGTGSKQRSTCNTAKPTAPATPPAIRPPSTS
jgi:hypothetical protein